MKMKILPLLPLTLVLPLAGCSGKPSEKAAVPAAVVQGVITEQVKAVSIPETVTVPGTVKARTSAAVLARIAGSINLLKVREGDRVRKGEVLAQLEAQESQSAAAAATAAMAEAGQRLAEAQSRKKLAEVTFERYQRLLQEEAVTRQEFDIKQTERELASQGLASAEARLQQAQAAARSATTVAGYTTIVAPISGVITAKSAVLGGTVFPAQPLFTIEDEGSYQLELAVPESLAAKVRPGMAVEVLLDAREGKFRGSIAEVVPAADPASHTFSARINLAGSGLKSGMFGRGEIVLGSTVEGLFVPRKAVVAQGALMSLWVVEKGGIVRLRLVKLGKTAGDRVQILSGVSIGETIAVTGAEKLSEGVKVE